MVKLTALGKGVRESGKEAYGFCRIAVF
jgi:hypothetical protein